VRSILPSAVAVATPAYSLRGTAVPDGEQHVAVVEAKA
jgi:hypothetical protein